MKNLKKSKGFKISPIIFVMFMLLLSSCNVPPYDSSKVHQMFPPDQFPTSHTYQMGGRTMHYVEIGDPTKPLLVLIPGSPGTWEAFGRYLNDKELQQKSHMIALDRPGLGKSDPGRWEPSLKKQVALLMPAIQAQKNGQPVVLLGHSFGGPVIARMMIDNPDLADCAIFLAASVDPNQEKTKWYQYVARWSVVNMFVPENLNVANNEIMPLKGELEKMLPLWGRIKTPSTIIQGTKDKLVPKENAEFARKMLVNAPTKVIYIEGQNHFIPWQQYEMVKEHILDHLHTVSQPKLAKN